MAAHLRLVDPITPTVDPQTEINEAYEAVLRLRGNPLLSSSAGTAVDAFADLLAGCAEAN